MSERDRQNPYGRNEQYGGSHRSNQGYDTPRQANQWQSEGGRQAGGDWQQDYGPRDSNDEYARNYRFSGQDRDDQQDEPYRSRLSDDDLRNDQFASARNYNRARQQDDGRDWQNRSYGSEQNRSYRDRGSQRSSPSFGQRDYDASGGNTFADFNSEDFGGGRNANEYLNRGTGAGISGGMHPSNTYRPSHGPGSWGRHRDDDRGSDNGQREYGDWRSYGESRGFLARAGDEVASWFGSEDAARRREQDRREDHSGRGPSNYTRSDDRIREDANDALTHDWGVDATHINVSVKDGEVTLNGTVDSRQAKRRAEDALERVSGVKHVQNNLRVQDRSSQSSWGGSGTGGSGASGFGSASERSSTSNASSTSFGSSGSGITGSGSTTSAGQSGAHTTGGIGSSATAGVSGASTSGSGTASGAKSGEKTS
jgi:hypothetical protein